MLAGRVAVVTGGAQGIGKAIVQRFQREGAKVVIADFARDQGALLAKQVGGTYCFTDVRDESTVESAMQTAYDEYGRIDVLVNNAVQFVFGHLGEPGAGSQTGTDKAVSAADWGTALQTNVVGYALCTQHASKFMRMNDPTDNVYLNDQGEGVSRIDAGSRGSIVNLSLIHI
eukprot:TRINITY_DN9821_c0_g1_i4.p1 TRINITY_DN9821_c0_g1~~TRINITY_DN9821_c0_g1_i4.p1  ORF type:complete len:172 (+),score=28.46 TRINITY_DN9821_c0_g1_i4:152-667(+)